MEIILCSLGIVAILVSMVLVIMARAKSAVATDLSEQWMGKAALLERRCARLESAVVKLDQEARRLHAEKREHWGIPDEI